MAIAPVSFEDYHRYRATFALHYARAILGTDVAEDACQEAWLRAWRSWESGDPTKRDAWLLTIVRHCCVDQQRARRSTAVLVDEDLAPAEPAEETVVSAMGFSAAWSGLQRLPKPLREVLWLREVVDLSYAEIASVQAVPVGTVMSRLHAARRKARMLTPAVT